MSTDDCFCSPSTDCPTLSRELGLYLREIITWEMVTLPNAFPYNDPTRYDRSIPYRLFKDIGFNLSPELYLEGSGDIIETPFNSRSIFNKFKMWMRINPYTLLELGGEAELDGFAYFGTFEIMGDSFDVQFSYINGPTGLTRPDEVINKYPYPHKLYGQFRSDVFEVPLVQLKNPNNTTDPTTVKNGIFTNGTSYPMSFSYFQPKGFRNLPFEYTVPVQVNGLIKQTASFYRTPVAVGVPTLQSGILYAERDNFNRDWYYKVKNPITQEAPFDFHAGKTYVEEKLGAQPYYNNTNMPLLNQTHSNTDLGQDRAAVPKAFYKNPIWELNFDTFEIEAETTSAVFDSKWERLPGATKYILINTLISTTTNKFKNRFAGAYLLYADVTGNNHIRDFLKHSYISSNFDPNVSDFNYARLSYAALNMPTLIVDTLKTYRVITLPSISDAPPNIAIVAEYGASIIAPPATIIINGGCVAGTKSTTRLFQNSTHCKFFSYTLDKNLAPHLKGEVSDIPLSLALPMAVDGPGSAPIGGIAPWQQKLTTTVSGACTPVQFPSNYDLSGATYYRYNGTIYQGSPFMPKTLLDIINGVPLVKPLKIEGVKIRWTGDWQ